MISGKLAKENVTNFEGAVTANEEVDHYEQLLQEQEIARAKANYRILEEQKKIEQQIKVENRKKSHLRRSFKSFKGQNGMIERVLELEGVLDNMNEDDPNAAHRPKRNETFVRRLTMKVGSSNNLGGDANQQPKKNRSRGIFGCFSKTGDDDE